MSINVFLFLLLGLLLIFFILLAWSLKRTSDRIDEIKRSQAESQTSEVLTSSLTLIQQQMGQLTQNVNQQLQNMSVQFQKTTGDIGKSLGDVQSHLGKVEVTAKEVLDKAKNISTLEDLLRAPKFRGGIGEFFLGDLLAQIFPPAYFTLQHRFKSGEKVDAAIKVGASLIPVDAKFPLENFKKFLQDEDGKEKEASRKRFITDVKKHIDTIASKYILPDEGTYDFALMYIPAENVYYETILKDEAFGEERSIFSHALEKKVIPVSPNSFFAYLQVIVLGLKGLQIEKSALAIFQSLARLKGDLSRFQTDFQTLGTHLVNAKSKFDDAEKRMERFSGRLDLLSVESPPALEEARPEKSDSSAD